MLDKDFVGSNTIKRPCPFCGEEVKEFMPGMVRCSCILFSESEQVAGVTLALWEKAYCWKELEDARGTIKYMKDNWFENKSDEKELD
jgi:hypothetical protein